MAQDTSLAVLVMNPIVLTFILSAAAAVSGDSSPYDFEQSYTPETQQYTAGKLDIETAETAYSKPLMNHAWIIAVEKLKLNYSNSLLL